MNVTAPKRAQLAGEERRRAMGKDPAGQRLALTAMLGFEAGVQCLSRPAAMRAGEGLGRLAYRAAGRQRRFAERNLRLAYGDLKTPHERNRLTRDVFQHLGKCLVDFLRGPALGPAQMDALVSCCGGEHLRAALDKGKGVILLTAHLGNWELLGRWVSAQGIPLTVVAREPEDPLLGGYLRRMRENAGFAVLSKGESARELLSVLRRGEAIILLPDQNSGDLFVPFFGVPAGTVAGPASLALHTGAALLPAYCLREADDRYRILFLPPIPVRATGDREADVSGVMAEVNRVLEEVIRRYPDQWLWVHNRWKSAFEEKNRPRWPAGFDFAAARARWQGE